MSGSWERLIVLLSFVYTASVTESQDNNPHAPVQQTWEVINEEGNPIWSITEVHPPWTWWPDLTPDICKLAAGSLTWDIPNHSDLSKPPAEEQCVPNGIGSTFGCSGQFYRAPDFFCAAWGCETTGEAYWNPTSTWDLITVRRNSSYDRPNHGERDSSKYSESGCAHSNSRRWNSPNGPCKNKYCNPIVIRFTDSGRRNHRSWLRGNCWGLRLDAVGKDPGLIVRIKLTFTNPSPMPIGPNQVLRETRARALPALMSTSPSDALASVTPLPHSEPSTGRRLLNLVEGAFHALNDTSPPTTESCWLCLSVVPPYYEEIAMDDTFYNVTTHHSCSWGTEKKTNLN